MCQLVAAPTLCAAVKSLPSLTVSGERIRLLLSSFIVQLCRFDVKCEHDAIER